MDLILNEEVYQQYIEVDDDDIESELKHIQSLVQDRYLHDELVFLTDLLDSIHVSMVHSYQTGHSFKYPEKEEKKEDDQFSFYDKELTSLSLFFKD